VNVMTASATVPLTKQYGLTACAKMSLRLSEAATARFQPILEHHQSNVHVEIQQRACEFKHLVANQMLRGKVFEAVPAATPAEEGDEEGEGAEGVDMGLQAPSAGGPVAPAAVGGDVDDLLGDLMNMTPAPSGPAAAPAAAASNDLDDLLGGLLGGPTPAPAPAPAPTMGGGGDLMDLMGGGGTSMPPAATPPAMMGGMTQAPNNTCTAYQKNGLTIMFQCLRAPDNPAMIQLNTMFSNSTPNPMNKFMFQAAVPKDMKLQLQTASGNTVAPMNSDTVKQVIKILNPQNKPLRVMMKMQYEINGQTVQDQHVAQEFPAGF